MGGNRSRGLFRGKSSKRHLGTARNGGWYFDSGVFPGATRAAVHTIRDGKQTEMVCEDEAGFFAVLLPGKKIPSYTLIYWDGDGNQMEHYDPYAYPMQFTEQEQKQFENGICYSIYEKMVHTR